MQKKCRKNLFVRKNGRRDIKSINCILIFGIIVSGAMTMGKGNGYTNMDIKTSVNTEIIPR